MVIPNSGRKRALIIVDVQPSCVAGGNGTAVANIRKLIREVPYDLYVESLFWCGPDTMWGKQTSAEEAFDKGYFTYVLEECTGSSSGAAIRQNAIAILRNVSLTNNSCVEDIPKLELAL